MYCTNCGSRNDDDARFCEHCGATLARASGPSAGGPPAGAAPPPPTPAGAVSPPPPARPTRRAWWYPIGVWIILSAFFLFVDIASSQIVTWAYWPIGILGIFVVGFTLLRRLEERPPTRPRRQGN